MSGWGARVDLQRPRGEGASVTQIELFFDLVFVFAITQLSHLLLSRLDVLGALHTALLFAAVWWAWIYTSWVTNWLDPQRTPVRLMLLAVMAGGLVMSAALPRAFEDRGLVFALAYAAVQLGRCLFMLWALRRHNPANARNFRRILVWAAAASGAWVAGGLAQGEARLTLWLLAVGIEVVGPMLGFATPGLGRSRPDEWDVEPRHMAERCSAFILIALGESLTVTGATFFEARWRPGVVAAFACAFAGLVALWWIYFDKAADTTAERFAQARNRGALARSAYTYLHALLVMGIVVCAVADERVLAEPLGRADAATLAVLQGGPALFLLGNGLFRRSLARRFAPSHAIGLALLAAVATASALFPLARLSSAITTVAVFVAVILLGDLFQARQAHRAVQTRP